MKDKFLGIVNDVTYRKGVEYFANGKIENVKQVSDSEYTSDVKGSSVYHVHLNVDEPHLSTCTCPYFEENKKICKHVVATYISLHPEVAVEDVNAYRSSLPKINKRKRTTVVRANKPSSIKKEVDPLIEKDKRAKKITRHYQLMPVSKDEVVTTSYKNKEYTYHPFVVGQRIKELRLKNKLTKDYIAKEYFDLKAFDISRWEAGYLPSLEDLDNLAWLAFDTSLEFLLTGKEEDDEDIDEEVEEVDIEKQKKIELGKHAILVYNSIDDYKFYKDDILNEESIKKYYHLKDYSHKVFDVKIDGENVLKMKLTYGVVFGGTIFYLVDEQTYTYLTLPNYGIYSDLLTKLCEFDEQLSDLVDSSEEDITISDELIELRNTLDKTFRKTVRKLVDSYHDEDEDIAEDDDGLTLDDIIFIEEFLE